MRIKVTENVLDYENKPIDGTTYRDVFSTALNNLEPGEQLTSDLKAKMYRLTHKIYASNEVKLTVDEAALLKERVALFYNPLVYGRVCDLLDGVDRNAEPAAPAA